MFLSEDYLRQKKSVSHHVRLIGLNDTKEYKMKILPWTKIIEIKQKIGKEISIKPNLLRIFYNNVEMIDKLTALDYQILNTKDNIIYYKCKELKSQSMNIQIYGNIICSTKLSFIIEEIKLGFQIGFAPSIIKDGTSGTYQMKDSNQNVVALFKPIDEEAFAPNNNKGYEGKFGQQSFRKGILSGEGNIREVVACIVDNDGFLRVPDTTFVEVTHKAFSNNRMEMFSFEDGSFSKLRKSIVYNFMIENLMPDFQGISIESDLSSESEVIKRKYGSLQKFINNSGVAADYGYNMFLKE